MKYVLRKNTSNPASLFYVYLVSNSKPHLDVIFCFDVFGDSPYEIFKSIFNGKAFKIDLAKTPKEASEKAYFYARAYIKRNITEAKESNFYPDVEFTDETGLGHLVDQQIKDGDIIHPDTIED